MRGRESKGTSPTGDFFFFYFPRTHMTLLPKPMPSQVTPSELTNRRSHHKTPVTNGSGKQNSPLKWSQTTPDVSEPSSPRVTCGGQIRMRAKAVASGSRKNWESVMEEMEKLYHRQHKRNASLTGSLGFKNDIKQFLTCLGRLKFGSVSNNTSAITNVTSDEEECCGSGPNESSETTFSKWFAILHEEQQKEVVSQIEEKGDVEDCGGGEPSNAVLLMRSSSVSARSWLEDIQEEEEEDDSERKTKEECEESVNEEDGEARDLREKEIEDLVLEEGKRSENLEMVMRYDTEYYKLSSDIAKETWVVADSFSRGRSRKR